LINNPTEPSRCRQAFELAHDLCWFKDWDKKIEEDEDWEAVYYWLNEAKLYDRWADNFKE
jgi:hypothetical protein